MEDAYTDFSVADHGIGMEDAYSDFSVGATGSESPRFSSAGRICLSRVPAAGTNPEPGSRGEGYAGSTPCATRSPSLGQARARGSSRVQPWAGRGRYTRANRQGR